VAVCPACGKELPGEFPFCPGILRDLGDRIGIAENLGRFAYTLVLEGRAATTTRLLSSSEALREQIGSASVPWVARMNEETLTTIRKQLDDVAGRSRHSRFEPVRTACSSRQLG
jgi:hypothetical protein